MSDSKNVDPFEEFEFRPLTEGLGFHGKTAPTAKPATKTEFAGGLENAPPNLDKPMMVLSPERSVSDLPTLKSPLPRKRQDTKEPATGKKVDDLLQTLQKKPFDFEKDKQQQQEPIVFQSPSGYDFSAIVLDTMLLIAGFLTCLIVLLMVTKVDLVATITSDDSSPVLIAALVGLFLFLNWMYLTTTRIFLGATPGEWVFDRRLGRIEQMGTFKFVGQVLGRATILILTGVITIPIFSLALGRDILGRWMGLEIHQI